MVTFRTSALNVPIVSGYTLEFRKDENAPWENSVDLVTSEIAEYQSQYIRVEINIAYTQFRIAHADENAANIENRVVINFDVITTLGRSVHTFPLNFFSTKPAFLHSGILSRIGALRAAIRVGCPTRKQEGQIARTIVEAELVAEKAEFSVSVQIAKDALHAFLTEIQE